MTTPAAKPFKIKAHDRRPSIRTTLALVGVPVASLVDGATVSFIMKRKGSDGLPVAGPPALKATATIEDSAKNIVRYDWALGDTATAGEFLGEWEVVDSNGLPQTFPTDSYNDIVIYQDLDNA